MLRRSTCALFVTERYTMKQTTGDLLAGYAGVVTMRYLCGIWHASSGRHGHRKLISVLLTYAAGDGKPSPAHDQPFLISAIEEFTLYLR